MKKIFFVLIVALAFNISLFGDADPNEAMNNLIELFKSYNVTSVPKKIEKEEFEKKVLNKIKKEKKKERVLSLYKKDQTDKFYLIKDNLDKEEKKDIENIFHFVGFKKLTEDQKKENSRLKKEIEKIFHYSSLLKGALATQWNKMSATQRKQIYSKFKQLVELVAYPQGSYFYRNSENNFKKAEN